MARLRIRGPDGERELPLRERAVIGRLGESEIPLNSLEVSRRHAVISAAAGGGHILEDLGSSNGTYVNGTRVTGSTSLVPGDIIRIGPWEFTYQAPAAAEPSIVIHGELTTHSGNHQLFEQDATRKLRTVLDIAHHLSQFSSLQELLDRMLEHLLGLFGKADHALVLLRERAGLAVRAARARTPAADLGVVYSRSVVRRVLEEGVAVVGAEDSVVTEGETLRAAGVRSFVCVPLKGRRGSAFGVLQLDCARWNSAFTPEDLHLLTAVSLQVSTAIENTTLHEELLEQERVKRDLALARLAQLAAGVAHEVNNPLSFVLNNTAVCRRDLAAIAGLLALYREAEPAFAETARDLRERVVALRDDIDLDYTVKNLDDLLVRSRDGLKRIQQIVQDLRSFARLNESEVDTVDLAPYLESAAAIARGLAEKRGVKLSCHVTALPPLPCQPARLNEAVFNLLANAIDACPAGGVVTLCGRPAAERIEVEVLDNGCGIDPALREKIFDPFFTTKPIGQGVGLGLSTSHGIVTEHGGAIDVESTPGKGSRFTIRLPLKGIGAPNDGTVKLGEAKAGPAS